MNFSFTKITYVVFDIETTGLSKIWHHIIEIATEVLIYNRTGVNNGNYNSLVQPPRNIFPVITQLTGIFNGDVAGCKIVFGGW